MSNSFGRLFRVTTWGESHGPGIGVVVDGCPSGLEVSEALIQSELDRRRPGQSDLTTPRDESDAVRILSGVFEGQTTGAPISIMVENKDQQSKSYDHLKEVYRPSHADYTYEKKYGIRDHRGGGRASARETIARVAAGAIAQHYLKELCGMQFFSYVSAIHQVRLGDKPHNLTREMIEATPVRCPNPAVAKEMVALIEQARDDGDSLGGVVSCQIQPSLVGLGAPVFDKLKADLAKAMMSIPATMGFQVGSGFDAPKMKGSEHNDPFVVDKEGIHTTTNNSGGMQGGISNGEPILFDVAFKPTGTIFKEQDTVDTSGKAVKLQAKGRHDPCVLPRAVPIVDAMASLVIIDHVLVHRGIA